MNIRRARARDHAQPRQRTTGQHRTRCAVRMYARGVYSGFIRYYAAPMPFRGGCRLAGESGRHRIGSEHRDLREQKETTMTRSAPHRLLVLRQLSRARQRLDLPDGTFTAEELRYLRSLPAVAAVSAGRIRYTEAFKRICMRQYRQGKSPARIFREAGLDSALIGYKRIERCIARWRSIGTEETPEQLAEDQAYERDLDRWRQVQSHMRSAAGANGRRSAASSLPSASGVSAMPAASSTRMVSAAATSPMSVARNSNSAPNLRASAAHQSQADRRQSEDLRDLLISQQIRRIVELERAIEAMRAACTCGACR